MELPGVVKRQYVCVSVWVRDKIGYETVKLVLCTRFPPPPRRPPSSYHPPVQDVPGKPSSYLRLPCPWPLEQLWPSGKCYFTNIPYDQINKRSRLDHCQD